MVNILKAVIEQCGTDIKGKLFLKVNLTIDGNCPLQTDDDDFDIVELIKSAKKDGTYFIWTCSCGTAACAGYYKGISVEEHDGYTFWNDSDLNKKYEFKTDELKAEVEALYEEVLKWNEIAQSRNEELDILPGWTMKYLVPAISK